MAHGPRRPRSRQTDLRLILRAGAIVSGRVVPAWQSELLARVAEHAELEVVVGAPRSPGKLLNWFDRWDNRRYRVEPDALASSLLAVEPVARFSSERDVVIAFTGVEDVDAPVAEVRDEQLFAQVARGEPSVEIRVEVRRGSDRRVLYSSSSATQRLSLYRNLNIGLWKVVDALPARLRLLEERGFDSLAVAPAITPPPGPGAVLAQLARTAIRDLRYHRNLPPPEDWFVAWRRGDEDWTELESRGTGFDADPFVLRRDGRSWIFFERYDAAAKKGVIAVAEPGAEAPRVVLDRPYHLSYPFVFEHAGEAWMVPESAANRTVDLYRATSFPYEWRLERTLLRDIAAVDSTLVEHEGRWWLFTLVNPQGLRANSELHLFSAASLEDEWVPHPLNPVVADAGRARPAGRVHLRDGRLHRLGQDCITRYGYAVVVARIDELTPERYAETIVEVRGPESVSGAAATHTYDSDGVYEVADGLRATTR